MCYSVLTSDSASKLFATKYCLKIYYKIIWNKCRVWNVGMLNLIGECANRMRFVDVKIKCRSSVVIGTNGNRVTARLESTDPSPYDAVIGVLLIFDN